MRFLFRTGWAPTDAWPGSHRYEERFTVWQAASADGAIAKAEAEPFEYAAATEEAPDECLDLAQSYALTDNPTHDGAEVFALIRDSNLDVESYLLRQR